MRDTSRASAGTTTGNVRRAMIVFAVALAALALFRSESFITYALDLPQNAVGRRVVAAAEGWHKWMTRLGTARITAAADAAMERLSSGDTYDDTVDDTDLDGGMDGDLPPLDPLPDEEPLPELEPLPDLEPLPELEPLPGETDDEDAQ